MSGTLLLVMLVLSAVLLALLKFFSTRQSAAHLSYRKLDRLLTGAERSFFGVLTSAVGDDLQIFAKVRIADVITPHKRLNKSIWQRAFNKISAKHFDFVLCKTDDLTVVCAIELDDKTHNSAKGRARDVVVNQACESAGLPLVRVVAKLAYTRSEIQESLKGLLPSGNLTIVTSDEKPQACPKCNSKLIPKIAKKGKNAGQKFLACSTYPKCRYTQSIPLAG